MNEEKESKTKGASDMNECGGYAIKVNKPWVTTKKLKRTPPSREYQERIAYMDSHNFSFSVDKETKKMKITITDK